MTPETLKALRFLAHAGDRDAELIVRAGDVADLVDEVEALRRQPVTRRSPESAARERRIYDLAIEIGQHWHDQDGVNGALLDELAQLVSKR